MVRVRIEDLIGLTLMRRQEIKGKDFKQALVIA